MPHHLNYTIHIKGNKTEFREIKVIIRQLKDVLIKTNGAQPGDTQIISVIEEQIKELYHQISIFEL